MRKVLSLVLVLLLSLPIVAVADGYDALTVEELTQKRDELIAELNLVNIALGDKKRADSLAGTEESLGKIKDIFPGEALAMFVRDKVGKFSIEQTVTQAELDTITEFVINSIGYGDFTDLTGIGYLRNLSRFEIFNSTMMCKELPDEFYTLANLKRVQIHRGALTKLSEDICNLKNLEVLSIEYTEVSALPESIGSLTNLKKLDIAHTKITSLPDSIWSLTLETIDMEGLPIK